MSPNGRKRTPGLRPHRDIRQETSATSPALTRMRCLRGESAPRLAGIFGVRECAIPHRIRREGWSKRALAGAARAVGSLAAWPLQTTSFSRASR